MALKKQVIYPNGTATDYHRIVDLHVVRTEQGAMADVLLYSYLSADKRNTVPAAPIQTCTYRVTITEQQLSGDLWEAAYNAIKVLPEWADALDC